MQPAKITVRLLERLQPGEIVTDTEVHGLFAERGLKGAIKLKFKADLRANGTKKTVKETLGTYPELSIDDARAKAMERRLKIQAGKDPREGTPRAPGMWTVERLFVEHAKDRAPGKKDGLEPRTLEDAAYRFDTYLKAAWGALPITAVTRSMAREMHETITRENGPRVANDTLRNFRACFNWAKDTQDLQLGENPVNAVTFNLERPRTETLTLPDLRDWAGRVDKLTNPLRRGMHRLGVLSGLRPSTLVQLERSWVRFDDKAIIIPKHVMKKRKEFHLPLSARMIEIVREIMAAGDFMYRGAPWLFPTTANDKSKDVIATQVWKERNLPNETGYILRHMFSNACHKAKVKGPDRMLLMGQKVPGIEGTYLNEPDLFEHLLGEQEKVSAYLTQAGV